MMCKLLLFIGFWLLFLPAYPQAGDTILVRSDIQLIHIRDSFFLHVTYDEVDGFGSVSSNGLFIIRNGNALMIDTPMDEDKTACLLNFLRDSIHATVTMFIPGHWHNDCIGGLAELHRRNVFSIANEMTCNECVKRNLEVPKASFSKSLEFSFGGIQVKCFYPGAGHSMDNVVVYFPDQKILFGGCLIKSAGSTGIGYIADGDVNEWQKSLKRVRKKFPNAEIIVPGHGSTGSLMLIRHTRNIIKNYLKKE